MVSNGRAPRVGLWTSRVQGSTRQSYRSAQLMRTRRQGTIRGQVGCALNAKGVVAKCAAMTHFGTCDGQQGGPRAWSGILKKSPTTVGTNAESWVGTRQSAYHVFLLIRADARRGRVPGAARAATGHRAHRWSRPPLAPPSGARILSPSGEGPRSPMAV